MSDAPAESYFRQMARYLDSVEELPLRHAIARIEATQFVGPDGKEYVTFPPRRSAAPPQSS